MSWIPSKEELQRLIIPSDERYYSWSSFDGNLSGGWKERVVRDMRSLLENKIIKVTPRQIPPTLSSELPPAILDAIPQEVRKKRADGWWLDYLNHHVKWCHHDSELGYLFARLLCHKYGSRFVKGWRVEPDAPYSGYVSDLALVNPRGECVIAVEIGNIDPVKLVEPFRDRDLKQLWHRPYYGLLSKPRFEWQKSNPYFVWSRGINWGVSLRTV